MASLQLIYYEEEMSVRIYANEVITTPPPLKKKPHTDKHPLTILHYNLYLYLVQI